MRVVLLGPPGVGKGTQARILADDLGVPHLSTGQMLRSAMAAETRIGLVAKQLIDDGKFVPDDLITAFVSDRIAMSDCVAGYVLDGFPRTIPQADALDGILSSANQRLDAVIALTADHEVLFARAARAQESDQARADDNADVLRTRLKIYHDVTAPLVPYYRTRGLLRAVDGMLSIADVTAAIRTALRS